VANFDNPYSPPRAAADADEALGAAASATTRNAGGKLWVDASKGLRLANVLIDNVILNIPALFVTATGNAVADWFLGLVGMVAYYALTEGFLGRSPAKFLTRTRVIAIDGGRPTFGAIFVRSVVRLIPFEPVSFLAGEGWHDRASKTRVVRAF